MKTISVSEAYYVITNAKNHIGKEFVVVNRKSRKLVAKFKILDLPESVESKEKYES